MKKRRKIKKGGKSSPKERNLFHKLGNSGWELVESDDDSEGDSGISDEMLLKGLADLRKEQPELMAEMFDALSEWKQEFIEEYGREPTDDDFTTLVDDLDLEGAHAEYQQNSVNKSEFPGIINTCAWCNAYIESNEERFSFGVKTRIKIQRYTDDPEESFDIALENGIQIRAIIPSPDSEAVREGYQLLVLCCSKNCVHQMQQGLRESMDIFDAGNVN